MKKGYDILWFLSLALIFGCSNNKNRNEDDLERHRLEEKAKEDRLKFIGTWIYGAMSPDNLYTYTLEISEDGISLV